MITVLAAVVGVGLLSISCLGQTDLDALMQGFLSGNFAESSKAQDALVELGDTAVPKMAEILQRNRDQWNRVKAVNVLGRIGTANAIEVLVTGIADSDSIVRDSTAGAIKKLDQSGKVIATRHLASYLVHNQLTARSAAGKLLEELGVGKADIAPGLAGVIAAGQGQQRELALRELAKLGREASGVIRDLLPLVNLSDPNLRKASLEILETLTFIGTSDNRDLVDILMDLLFSIDFDLRQEAIWGLRRMQVGGREMVEPVMARLIGSDYVGDRELGVDILIQLAITQPEAVEALKEIAQKVDWDLPIAQQAVAGLKSLVPALEYHLDRGLIAVLTEEGVFLSWRLLGTEPLDLGFHIYRNGEPITSQLVVNSTNYLDLQGTVHDQYTVVPVLSEPKTEPNQAVGVWPQNYLSIPLARPEGGVTPAGERYRYSANDGSAADLDGDGRYEIILKWDPSNAKDNAHDGYTGNVYIDAYTLEGEMLWRIDLGKNIRAGAHYTQFIVYDLDLDGKAELVVKTADGTVDGQGNVIGDPNADYRDSRGRILRGPEYLTVFDGETGRTMATIDYKPLRGNVGSWGDGYGNRSDRFLAGVAYLDGVRPSVIMARGYYTRTVLVAYNWEDGELKEVWTFDTASDPALRSWEGQGNHQLSVADVDYDGRQEIIYGAIAIDHDSTGLYNTRLGHGDALHVADHDPGRVGLEVWAVHESVSGMNLRDARTGEVLWGVPTGYDVGRGVAANIDPRHRGSEAWASGSQLMDIDGNGISRTVPSMNFTIWWDGDLQRELLDGTAISKYDWERDTIVALLSPREVASNNGSKATPTLQADLFGDWREEVVWRTHDSGELRIYTATDLTEHRMYTLMHDPMYRVAVAWQNVAYNQPPHPSFYVGEDMEPQVYHPGSIKGFLEEIGY
jgi:rhamnogalacturonan endolyase